MKNTWVNLMGIELISYFTQVIQQEKNFKLNQKAGTFKINKVSSFFYNFLIF